MSEILIVLLLISSGSNFSHDLLSIVDADDYFKAHHIEVKADALVELVGKDPEDTKGQVAQLLALRWLGEHPDQAKKVKKARTTVQQIAEGNEAQDQLGFAKDYARTTLALLDGKPAPKLAPIPANSVAGEALKWFPDSASIFGAYDLRASGELAPVDEDRMRSVLLKMLTRPQDKEQFYKWVDGAGNIRLDRVSFGYAPDPQDRHKSRNYVRSTGLADRKAMADLLKKRLPDAKVEFKKGPKGRLMTVISSEKHGPAFALVGDTDMLVCGHDGQENALEVLEEALDVQAGNKAGILKGTYAAKLKKVPGEAVGVLMGDIPEELRRDMVRDPKAPFKALPKSIVAVMTRTKSINIDWHGTMADAEDAKAFAESVADLKKQGIEQLKQLPPQLKIKPD
ncbi:MAG TPA: hypothetical protein VG013_26315 [Gemmataceae bacterium]|nr:hypothetical protein [Gemmataceae bacterium]